MTPEEKKIHLMRIGRDLLKERWNPDSQADFEEEINYRPTEFSEMEQSYRRGYCHGFLAARRNPELKEEKVYGWRYSDNETGPPGSAGDGVEMEGLKKGEEDKFFIRKLENNWDLK